MRHFALLLLMSGCLPVFGQWTSFYRHGGAYAQGMQDCNLPGKVSYAGGILHIDTAKQDSVCPTATGTGTGTWPYATGGIEWSTFSYLYGTLTVRAKMPPSNTVLWPAIWMMSTNFQAGMLVPFDAPGGGGGLDSTYNELDVVECMPGGAWCQLNMWIAGAGQGACTFAVDAGYHTYAMSWTPTAITLKKDGVDTGCSYSSIPVPMFLIIQTQVTSPTDANLPGDLAVEFVEVRDSGGNVIFRDDFNHLLLPWPVGH